jgi:hypothetical protein
MGKTGRLLGGEIGVDANGDDFAVNLHTGFLVAMAMVMKFSGKRMRMSSLRCWEDSAMPGNLDAMPAC